MLSHLHLAVSRLQEYCVCSTVKNLNYQWIVNSDCSQSNRLRLNTPETCLQPNTATVKNFTQNVLLLRSGWMMLLVIHGNVVGVSSELMYAILRAG